ncbi:MAG: hypothetical protein R3D25_19580 [Geminicoccaceae bacterium]
MAITTTGRPSTTLTTRRRRMSRYSSLGPVSRVTVSGSSAMPQIGQSPGPTGQIRGAWGR